MIEVGKDYKIDADKFQYILLTRTIGKDKDGNEKEHWKPTYHANIQQCCNAIADERLRFAIQRGIVNQFNNMVQELCVAVKLAEEAGNE
jgi:hypothetical protein